MKRILFCLSLCFTLLFSFILNAHASTTYNQGVVKTGSSVYTQANSSSARVKSDTGSNIVLYSPEAVEIIGESGNYYQIRFLYAGFTYTGYINKGNVTSKVYTTDDNYEKELINKGFPSDYAKKLAVLHAIHPNWEFTPSNTHGVQGGMDFYTAVNGEAEVIARNLIDSSNTSLRSTADGAYKNGEWIPLDGDRWYAASKQTIAFFMDPRNFLDESHIFMFENLGYNAATQTADTVNKVLGGTFMNLNNPFNCTDTSNNCPVGLHYYTNTLMMAGKDRNVSPVHLATRIIQEQGSGGSVLSLGKGYNGDFIGYYNFFNIGASGKGEENVIINGLTYAKNRNWNNQHVSIYEGSTFLASSYINRGQSTIYYQKFDVETSGSMYGHQYMQNVKAPYSEGYNTYTSYFASYSSQEDWNKGVYDFLIPIYSNMGGSTTLDASGNADATLKELSVSSCRLNPTFQSSAYNYDCYAPMDTKSVTISATATNSLAKVNNPGTITLNSNDVVTSVGVTAANGNTATYTINIHRIETDGFTPVEVLNGIGLKVTDSFVSNLEAGMDVSNIINSITNKYHFATVKVTEANGSEITSGTVKTGQKIIVSNTGITTTFTLVLYGDTSGDGLTDIRDLLIIQKHLVKSKTISGEYLKSSDLNKDGLVDIRDLLLEQKYLLKAYTISQG